MSESEREVRTRVGTAQRRLLLCCFTAEMMYGDETNPHLLKIIFERVLLGVVVVERKLIMGVRERWLAEGGV